MTRLLSLLVVAMLIVSLVGCGSTDAVTPTTTSTPMTTTVTTTTHTVSDTDVTTTATTSTTAVTTTSASRSTVTYRTIKATATSDTTSVASTTKTEETTMTTTQTVTTVNPDAPLEGKSAIFVGDSIAYGCCTNGEGFAHHVKDMWGLGQALNGAVNGAEVTPRKGDTQQYIYNQLKTFTFWEFDYVLLHGGVNDVVGVPHFDANVPLGTLSNDGNYDTSTFAGALEKEIAFALETWPNAKIGYIINYDLTDPVYRPRMREYVEVIRTVCDKWNIPTLDLFDGKLCPSEDGSQMVTIGERYDTTHGPNAFMADQFHPTAQGYEILAKYIGEFMVSMPERS